MEKKKTTKKQSRYSKRNFLITFLIVMGLFAAIRHGFSLDVPLRSTSYEFTDEEEEYQEQLAEVEPVVSDKPNDPDTSDVINYYDTMELDSTLLALDADEAYGNNSEDVVFNHSHHETTVNSPDDNLMIEHPISSPNENASIKRHHIKGVWSYNECFPDINDVQLLAAKRYGITPVQSRKEAEQYVSRHKLVNVTHSPFYAVDSLTHSMPYLVPRAQQLLNTISLNFIDSCQVKGLPIHLPIVTSVLRTTDDVSKLQRGNKNATTNSCHCYGTTVDISYTKFYPVADTYSSDLAPTRWNEPLKRVLSEVLNDLRLQGKCYVKYERRQACFHLTCR